MNNLILTLQTLFCIGINYLLLSLNLWFLFPDIFLMHLLLMAATNIKYPKIYFFILQGFMVDLFFMEWVGPYTAIYFLSGLYLNFSIVRWIQKSLFIQLIYLALISILLNLSIGLVEGFALIDSRIFISTFWVCLLWMIIFILQRDKWLKNI